MRATITEPWRSLLSHAPIGIATDFDGTLSPITARPEDATLPLAAREALRLLTQKVAVVAVVSGRPAHMVAHLVGLPEVVCIGSHGLERVWGNEVARYTPRTAALYALAIARDAVEAALDIEPGVLIEDKGLSFAVHYRLAPDPRPARLGILHAIQRLVEPALQVIEGRRVVEVRIAAPITKGTALTELAQQHGLASLAYFGDDTTDLDAFAPLADLRSQGVLQTLSVAVANQESPLAMSAADLTLNSVEEVSTVLSDIGRMLPSFPRSSRTSRAATT